jgi:hypothetical protein
VSPGCKGRIVDAERLLTIGVGASVIGFMGERRGDHNGHRVLYGGIAAHVGPVNIGKGTASAIRGRINPRLITIVKHTNKIILFNFFIDNISIIVFPFSSKLKLVL